MLCDPLTNYPSLQLQWASKGSSQQRRGRTLSLLLITRAVSIGIAHICGVIVLTSRTVDICYLLIISEVNALETELV